MLWVPRHAAMLVRGGDCLLSRLTLPTEPQGLTLLKDLCLHNQNGFCKFGARCHRKHENEICQNRTAEKGTPGYADTTASSDTASLDRAVPIAIKWKESV